MAIVTTNGASTARTIPGAPQKLNGGSQKKKKSSSKTASNGNGESIDQAAHAAALTDKAPSLDKLDDTVKVKESDVAEQAENQAALEAIKIVEQNGGHAEEDKHSSSALQAIISKRIKVLNKKLQRAVAYSELSEDKLNADMRRIIASKGNLEGAVNELTEVLKAIELNEKEQIKQQHSESKTAIFKLKETLLEENAKKINVLFQFMYLYSLVNASMQPQFAPPPLPAVLQNATSEQVAAIGKLYSDLSASNEVSNADVKSTLLDKLFAASSDVILGSVTYKDVSSIIEGLSSSVVQQPPTESVPQRVVNETEVEDEKPSIRFIQASEIEHANETTKNVISKSIDEGAPNEVNQAEPEGGAVDGVPADVIDGGASSKGINGPSEVFSKENDATSSSKQVNVQDGSAKASVEEPVQTTEVAKIASGAATPSTYKVIDWSAHDDDDFGDLEMQPEPSKIVAPSKLSQDPILSPTNGQAQQKARNGEAASNKEKANNHSRQGSNQSKQRQRGKDQHQQQPVPKLPPQVDEDGFTIASSKRTKMLMQQQAANATRGGRAGNGSRSNQRSSNQNFNGPNGTTRSGNKSSNGANVKGKGRGKGTADQSETVQ